MNSGVDLCLLNEPDRSEKAVCGNGIVEEGEDCDCGQGVSSGEFCRNSFYIDGDQTRVPLLQYTTGLSTNYLTDIQRRQILSLP